jgi:hypothetical protein
MVSDTDIMLLADCDEVSPSQDSQIARPCDGAGCW